jgi:thiol-disulfide isomerase/thioredoxin
MRAPVADIPAPPFPSDATWVNVASMRMDKQLGRPVLLEFWDFCRPNSLRTLPYVKGWHERYAGAGLRVVSVHCPGFEPSRDEEAVRSAVARLGIEHPVCLDTRFELWRAYDNEGWPARYLFDQAGHLFEAHAGEGGYVETELAVQELLGVEREPLGPVHPEDEPSARIVAQSPDRPGAWSGPYAAGAAWAVLDGEGDVFVDGRTLRVEHAGAYVLAEHPFHTEAQLDLRVGPGVTCHAVLFTPGLAPPGA